MLSLDVIVLPAEGDPKHWILYNVFTRSCLGVESRAFAWLAEAPLSDKELLPIWMIGWFSNEEGTVADPTRYRRVVEEWGAPKLLSYREFLEVCQKEWLIIADEAAYRKRFSRKTSLLDSQHFGNFHDQMGAHLILRRRTSPSSWWLKQKFTPDLKSIRSDNLYGQVQERFLRDYFPDRLHKGAQVLDVGCGIGFYTNLIANLGCEALGIDPNREYIEIARRQSVPGASFDVKAIGKPGSLNDLSKQSFDYIFIQDTLLFYFITIGLNDSQDLALLLDDLHQLLKPGGLLLSIEPHSEYYLAPWLGSEKSPFTIITEHRNRRFTTVPTQTAFTNAILKGGFELKRIEELYYSAEPDTRGTAFAHEFPPWTLFEFAKPKV